MTIHEIHEKVAERSRSRQITLVVSGALWLGAALILMLLAGCASSGTMATIKEASELPAMTTHYTPSEGDSMGPALKQLAARLEGAGITVDFLPDLVNPDNAEPVFGLSWVYYGKIQIRSNLSVNGQFETLAHEAGHFFHLPNLERTVREVFAELVAVGVMEAYGSKTARHTSAQWLAWHKQAFGAVQYMQSDIDLAVKVLTDPDVEWKWAQPGEQQ